MIETVKEGLEKYKDDLEEYLEWITECKKRRSIPSPDKINYEIYLWNKKDHGIPSWYQRLHIMRETLGITDEENKRITAEVKGQ